MLRALRMFTNAIITKLTINIVKLFAFLCDPAGVYDAFQQTTVARYKKIARI